ncbi:hypothetical protein [Pseudonocardia sp.]|uniref:hypothetical protein n=1 Tax=Pseudonocardia sp. TaxID=60912 RepID=UPI003D12331B
MTGRRRPTAGERIDDDLESLRRDVDELAEEVHFLRNLWALAPFARSGPRRRVLLPRPRQPVDRR